MSSIDPTFDAADPVKQEDIITNEVEDDEEDNDEWREMADRDRKQAEWRFEESMYRNL